MKGFAYACEKFSAAQSSLMLPHRNNEAMSIVMAFHECSHGMMTLNRDALDDEALRWIDTLERHMDVDKIDDPDERGTWLVKAESLSDDDKAEISLAIVSLAHWFRYQLSERLGRRE